MCARPAATDKSPLRLPRQWYTLPLPLFFNGWPALFIPLFDGLLISLSGSLNWLLSAPACFAQQSSHVVTMITNLKHLKDHLTHALCCPHIPLKAIRLSSSG